MRVKGHVTLPNVCLRVLVKILAMHDRGETISYRRIAGTLRLHLGTVQRQIARLRKHGLITMEPWQAGTLVPKCSLQMFKQKTG